MAILDKLFDALFYGFLKDFLNDFSIKKSNFSMSNLIVFYIKKIKTLAHF